MIFVVGALVGSFAGLSIYRIPLRQSIIVPDSHCPHCNTLLAAKDLMPIISWLWLRGKCRYCRERIARRELLVEVVSGILYVAVYWQIGGSIMLLPSLIFIYFLLVVAWIDYDCQLIFNKVMAAMLAGGMMLKLLVMQNRGEVESGGVFLSGGIDSWCGFAVGGGLMFLLFMISGGMGLGDVWFAAVMGFWLGVEKALLMLFLSFGLGGIIGSLLLLFHVKHRKDYIAFGPFMAAAGFISYLYGVDMICCYQNLLR